MLNFACCMSTNSIYQSGECFMTCPIFFCLILIALMVVIYAVSEERCNEVESLVFDLFANLGATGARDIRS